MSMLRPGTSVTSRTSAPPRGGPSATGAWFVVGAAERGSLTAPHRIRNMADFDRYLGGRITQSLLHDSLDAFFRDGGQVAHVQRVSGPSGVTAFAVLNDSTATASLRVEAKNPGTWGNQLSVAIEAGTDGGYVVVVTHATRGQVDRSPSLATQSDAVNWSNHDDRWVNISIAAGGSTNNPDVVGATALAGGADDYAGITDSLRIAALGRIPADLGPGQVSVPGNVGGTVRAALLTHAEERNRVALLDATNTGTVGTLVAEGQSLQGNEHGALFAPWVVVPGSIPGIPDIPRTIPPSALAAALMARNDATNSPNVAAAGDNGVSRYAVDVSQPAFTDAERDQLDSAGVNVIRNRADGVTLYGNVTLASPSDPSWKQLSNQRFRMVLTANAHRIAQAFVFDQIDGKGHKIAEFAGALTGMLLGYHTAGSLYGPTPDDAFQVEVGPSVNTPETIADGQLLAVMNVRMSPSADFVAIEIVKTSVTQAL